MTTKIRTTDRTLTDQARTAIYDSAKLITKATMDGGTHIAGQSYWAATCATTSAIYHVSEKSAEAQRQIDRIRSLWDLCQGDDETSQKCINSVSSAVSLIGAFLTSPIPIPVASAGEDGQTSLFIDGENFYGDLEINGDSIEYYIKFDTDGDSVEYFNSEKIEDGFIPPKLLTHLFYHYAQK